MHIDKQAEGSDKYGGRYELWIYNPNSCCFAPFLGHLFARTYTLEDIVVT